MSLKILVDMNLSPGWISRLEAASIQGVHWSSIGDPRAPDRLIMDWAQENDHVIFTHDLDFGHALALTHKRGPSVIQLRSDDVLPDRMGIWLSRRFDCIDRSWRMARS